MKKPFIWNVVLLLLIANAALILYLVTMYGDNSKNVIKSSSQQIVPIISNIITTSEQTIAIQATTNLPEETVVKYNLWYQDKYNSKSNIENIVSVKDGILLSQFEIDSTISPQRMTLNTEVFFNSIEQPKHVKDLLGEKGELLSGNNIKALGEYNAILVQDHIFYPDEESYSSSLSHEDQIKNAVYDILPDIESVSIVKKDEKYIVEATYNLTDGFGLKNFAEQVARDYTFAVYATGLPIAQSYIVINKPDGTPGLIVIVGNNQAKTQPESTWSSKV